MRGRLIAVAMILALAIPGLVLAKGINLNSLFPNLTLGTDPNSADSVYCVCSGLTQTSLTIKVRLETDNADPFDYIQGTDVELQVTTDKPGVTLDTTVATVFGGGSAVNNWGYQAVSVASGGGDPSVYPLKVTLGAVELPNQDTGSPLGPGDYLYATLRFNVSSPTNFTVNGTTITSGPATLVTTVANGYSVQVFGKACGPIVPTLSEWGLIVFGALLLGGMVWYLRRKPVTVAA